MSDYLWISEMHLDATDNVIVGDVPPYETYIDDIGKLFRSLQKEYGGCVSKVYIDRGEESIPIGWVFAKRIEYEESRPRYDDWGKRIPVKTYMREMWITLHTAPDTVVTTPHVMDLRTHKEVA